MSTQQAAEAGQLIPEVISLQHSQIGRADKNGPQGKGYQIDLAFTQDSRPTADAVAGSFGVRRLTPRECERLQYLPDDHTAWGIDEAGQRVEMSDSARYRQCGNAVNAAVSRWLGKRIVAVLSGSD